MMKRRQQGLENDDDQKMMRMMNEKIKEDVD
jgi:hypothetical protein